MKSLFTKYNNKLIAFIIVVLFIGILGSCNLFGGKGSSSNGDAGNMGTPQSVQTSGVKQVFRSNIQFSDTSRSVMSRSSSNMATSILSYINEGGSNAPVIFTSSAGKEVILEVICIYPLKEGFIAIEYNAVIEVAVEEDEIVEIQRISLGWKQALIDFSSGNVYDLSGYDVNNMLIDGENIYITDYIFGDTLYKITLSDLSKAIPLNNPEFFPIGELLFITSNGKIVVRNAIIDSHGLIPPKVTQPHQGINIGNGYSKYIINPFFIDRDGEIWGYNLSIQGDGDNEVFYNTHKVDVDDEGQTIITNSFSDKLYTANNYEEEDAPFIIFLNSSPTSERIPKNSTNRSWFIANERLYIYRTGYFYVKEGEQGGIIIEGTNFLEPIGHRSGLRFEENLYWLDNQSIKKMPISQNNTIESIYENTSMISSLPNKRSPLWLVDDYLYFYQFFTATNVGTFRLKIGETEPELVAEYDMEAQDIVQVVF